MLQDACAGWTRAAKDAPFSDHSTDYTANEWSSQLACVMTHLRELPNVTRTDSLCALSHFARAHGRARYENDPTPVESSWRNCCIIVRCPWCAG